MNASIARSGYEVNEIIQMRIPRSRIGCHGGPLQLSNWEYLSHAGILHILRRVGKLLHAKRFVKGSISFTSPIQVKFTSPLSKQLSRET